MLHTGTSEGPRPAGHDPGASSRVLIAFASPPRLGDPSRWGWPHWLAPPAYKAEGHRSPHRALEHYR
jgi:hypothetical protein